MTTKLTVAKPVRKPSRKADQAKAPAATAPAPQAAEATPAAEPRFFFFLFAYMLDNGAIDSLPAYFDGPNLSRATLERVRGAIIQQHGRNAVITGVSSLGLMTAAEFEGSAPRPAPAANAANA